MSLSGAASGAIPKTPDAEEGDEDLPNQISASYEVPQFPIEQIEKKLMLQRHLTAKWVDFKINLSRWLVPSNLKRHEMKSLINFCASWILIKSEKLFSHSHLSINLASDTEFLLSENFLTFLSEMKKWISLIELRAQKNHWSHSCALSIVEKAKTRLEFNRWNVKRDLS